MAEKHIAIICSFLNFAGGYERIVVETANMFVEKGLKVTLLLFAETNESFYPIDPRVTVIQKNVHFGITPKGNVFTRKAKMIFDLITLRKIVKDVRPDILICAEYPFAAGAILCGAKKYSKVVSWEHTHYESTKRNFFWEKLFRLTYPKLDIIVCLNKREQEFFGKFNKTCIIPNFTSNKTGILSGVESKTILSIGTLIPRKGIDLLMQSAKEILRKYPDWRWKLIGSGPMQEQVVHFIRDENLTGRFILQDSVSSQISEEYLSASIFALTSRNETLPMVLLEAISYGLPCVSFDCETGPADIINHNRDGLLVEKENSEKFAESLSLLIEEDSKRKQMAANAFENSKRFSPETIYQLWEALFNDRISERTTETG
jgi:glycosyltransferase involved in cell wall biosynthesis